MTSRPSPQLARTHRVTERVPAPVLDLLRAARRRGWAARELLTGSRPAAPPRPALATARARLLVGPANFAGQAHEWAHAAERFLPGVAAVSMAVDRGGLAFPADYVVPLAAYRSRAWEREQWAWLTATFTHLLVDAMRPLTGALHGEDCRYELPRLRGAGLRVALAAHGSDVRLPSRHRELYPWSPFDPELGATRLLERQARRLAAIAESYDGPVFGSTPDLPDFLPRARWLPTVVPTGSLGTPSRPALERGRPVVVHIPTNPWLKGSEVADPVLGRLHDAGVIEYRRLSGLTPDEVRREVREADVLLDQLRLGNYGVVAIQAMAAGRLVLGHVPDRVRARVGRDLPVVEVTPETLGAVVEAVAAEPERFRPAAVDGVAFAAEVHDGRRSAEVLADFLQAGPD